VYSYSWSDLINVGSTYGKGIPLAKVNVQMCDFVSQDMYQEYPWKQTITNTANGAIPLIDSVQDYTFAAPNLMRALKASLTRTDVTPNENRDLEIVNDLSVDLYPRSYLGIRQVSAQQATGLFRLESAVQIPAGVQIELRVDYQINPIKVTSLGQIIWFDDRFSAVALEGLLYWVYKLADDQRAGSATTDAYNRVTGYTGQLGSYKGALGRMKNSEDYGFTQSVFPSDPMGLPRDCNALNIFGPT
jgi:hypothetical protein